MPRSSAASSRTRTSSSCGSAVAAAFARRLHRRHAAVPGRAPLLQPSDGSGGCAASLASAMPTGWCGAIPNLFVFGNRYIYGMRMVAGSWPACPASPVAVPDHQRAVGPAVGGDLQRPRLCVRPGRRALVRRCACTSISDCCWRWPAGCSSGLLAFLASHYGARRQDD